MEVTDAGREVRVEGRLGMDVPSGMISLWNGTVVVVWKEKG